MNCRYCGFEMKDIQISLMPSVVKAESTLKKGYQCPECLSEYTSTETIQHEGERKRELIEETWHLPKVTGYV